MVVGVFLYGVLPVFVYQTVFSFIPYRTRRGEVLGMLASLLNVAFMASFAVVILDWSYSWSLILGVPAVIFALARLISTATRVGP